MAINPTPSARSHTLPLGYKLGEYTIVTVLGDGGFGITYRARDMKLGLDVAIKEYFPGIYATRAQGATIMPKTSGDLENYRWGLSAFLKEAQALAKFKHPQIVRVLRFLEANGTAYTIMEYEEGETLTAYLKRHGGVLLEARLLQIFLPVLNGLHAVHEAGLLHLDIKPDNIYMRRNEQPMLIDFGSSRQMRGDSEEKITLTPGFCAPEQYPGHGEIGVASDVYGMGATLYRCITGKNPLDSLARQKTYDKLRNDPLPPATSFTRPTYAPHIREAIDSALKLAIDERPPSAFALQQALMGKDLTKIAERPVSSLYRPGTGFIGVLLPPEKQKIFRRRYTFFEKAIAVIVFIATFAIVVPKFLIDTDRMSQSELFGWIDNTQRDIVERAREFGDLINEKVFGVAPRPKVVTAAPAPKHAAPKVAEPNPAEILPRREPFGAVKERAADIVLPEPAPRALGFLKHGAVLAVVTADGLVQLWDVATGEARATLPTLVSDAAALGVFPSSQWVAVMDRDEAIAVFDPLGNREYVLRNDPPHAIGAIAVTSDGLLLAELAADSRITIWDLSQQRTRQTWDAGKGTIARLAFSPDGRILLTGDKAGNLTAWRSADATQVTQWRAHERPISEFAFSPDGRRLASADASGELRIWKSTGDTWQPAHTLPDAPPTLSALTFSPDGEWLTAVGAGTDIYIWDADTGALAHRITTDRKQLRALAVSDDGKLVAVASDDNLIRLWK
jgi:serine/threonine protein kinase